MGVVKRLMFAAALDTLFGPHFGQLHGAAALQRAFHNFDDGFELAASPVPHALQLRFTRARRALLEAFR